MQRDRALELLRGVLGPSEQPAWQRRMRVRAQMRIGVAYERKNRVVERRGGQFDLPPRARRGVSRDDATEQIELHLTQHGLVVFGELTSLLYELREPRIAPEPVGIHPRELVPDLQVAQIGRLEVIARLTFVQQFEI